MMTLAFVLALFSSATAQDEVLLRLQFKEGEREETRFDLETTMNLELSSDAFSAKQATEGRVQFTLKNACKKEKEGSYVFEAVFGDEKVKIWVKGRNVKMEGSDGDVVVDTEKGLNPKLAEPMLKELDGFGVAGDLEVDARGLVKQPKKRKRLPKLLQGVASSGNLYPFVLPEKAVRVGEEWTYENELNSLGELRLTAGKAIKIPFRYRLERVEGEGASRVAVFSTKVDTELKDVEASGKMEGVAGDVTLKIRKLTYQGTGETRFLPAAGRVSTSRIDVSLKADMSAEGENQASPMEMKMSMSFKAKTEPAGKKKREF